MEILNVTDWEVIQTRQESEVMWNALTKPVRKPTTTKFQKLVRKACKQMVSRAKKVNRLARQTAWGAKQRAYRNYVWDGHHAHVNAMWNHLRATKGKGHVDQIVEVRKLLRNLNLNLNGTIKG